MIFILLCIDECYVVRSPTVMERDWFFGNVVCIYCHWFSGFRDAQSERRLSICLKSLSLTSSTFVRAFRSCGNWHISVFCCCLGFVLCSGALFFLLRVGFCTFVASQDIVHRLGPNMVSNLKQFVQRFPVRDFWLPVFEFVFNSYSISRASI